MWNSITRADLDHAKEQLKLRYEETLRKHAEEIRVLDADHAGIETLDRMVAEFAGKFKIAATSSSKPSDAADSGSTDSTDPASRYLPAAEIWPARVA